MIISSASLLSGSVLRSRFCVVGSGIGGSAVLKTLVEAGHDVLLVEAGDVQEQARDRESVTDENVGRPFRMLRTRCIELGGTSNLWHGICTPLDDIDFEPRPWMEDSGWPIRRTDIAKFYDEASDVMGVLHASDWDANRVPPYVGERSQDIPFNAGNMENKLFQSRKPPLRWKNTLLELANKDNLRCLVNAPALELVVSENNSTIEYLVVGAGEGTISVYAEVFIVCAGTLETPRLLLNSRRRLHAGVGNGQGLVGKYLLDHPNGHFCKLGFHRRTSAPLYAGMPLDREHADVRLVTGLAFSVEQQRRHRLPNNHVYIRPSLSQERIDDDLLLSFLAARGARDLTFRQIRAILTHRDILYRILMTRFGVRPTYLYGDLFFMTEQLPNRHSCVRLSDHRSDRYGYPVAQIDWQLGEADFLAFARYTKLLFSEGLQSENYSLARVDELSIWNRTVASAAHHLGTARMASQPSHGVVRPDLQVFGTDNLYICDGSVFPTAGSANPALTITALGLRLATHLIRSQQPLTLKSPLIDTATEVGNGTEVFSVRPPVVG